MFLSFATNFKDGAHRSKTEFILGPGSGVKVSVSDIRLFVNLSYTEHLYFACSVFESPRLGC